MVAERFNGLALFHVHKDIIVNIDKVIDLYAMKNQRLKFYLISILINGSLNAFINKDTDTYTQHLELFMNAIEIKEFCNRYHYEMQKSWIGGGNDKYKILMSRVEEGYIPQTISYAELFINTLKIKNNLCNGHQYEMQKSCNGGENNAYPIFSSGLEEENIPNKISYMNLFMTTMKIKNNFGDGYQYEMQKSQDGGGNNAYKTIMSRVEEGDIPNTIYYVELLVNTLKIKNNLCNGHQYEMQKSGDGGENNAYKIFTSWLEEGYIPNLISYVELFMNTLKIKNSFCN